MAHFGNQIMRRPKHNGCLLLSSLAALGILILTHSLQRRLKVHKKLPNARNLEEFVFAWGHLMPSVRSFPPLGF